MRNRVKCGISRNAWALELSVAIESYDGASIRITGQLGPWWFVVQRQLWYSATQEQRVWDRYEAECLAGEHPGVTVLAGSAVDGGAHA